MGKVVNIAWREFKHTALTKAFIIGTIIFPLLIWGGMLLVPWLLPQTAPPLTGTVVIIDRGGEVARAAEIEFERERERSRAEAGGGVGGLIDDARGSRSAGLAGPVRLDVQVETHTSRGALEQLRDAARDGEYLAIAIVDPVVLLYSNSEPSTGLRVEMPVHLNPDHADAIRRVLASSVVRARVDRGLPGANVEEIRAMLRPPSVELKRLTAEGEAAGGFELQRILPIAFMILLWIAAFASGNYLLTTTIEEKSNKVMEVLLSAVSPWQLMTGKIIGQGVVGLFTIAVYGMLGLGALYHFGMLDLISPAQIVYLALFFFMAYFMVAAMMAAVGSAVSDLQEAHALITPAMLILFIPMLLFVPVSQDPNGALATITSHIPPLTPFVMIIRVTSAEPVPLPELITAISAGIFGVLVMLWMAARVFRVGVLMYGKPPSPTELLRWLRYS